MLIQRRLAHRHAAFTDLYIVCFLPERDSYTALKAARLPSNIIKKIAFQSFFL